MGSGFSRSVATLRLGQARYKVIVLERRLRWDTQPDRQTFPLILPQDSSSAWFSDHANLSNSLRVLPIIQYPALIDRIKGNGLDALRSEQQNGASPPQSSLFFVYEESQSLGRRVGRYYPPCRLFQ